MTYTPSPDPQSTEELAARVLELSTRTADLAQHIRADLTGIRSDIRTDLNQLGHSIRADSLRLGQQVSDEVATSTHVLTGVIAQASARLLVLLVTGPVLIVLATAVMLSLG